MEDNRCKLISAHLLTSPEAAIAPGEALLAGAALGDGITNAMIEAGRYARASGYGRRYRVPTISAVATLTVAIATRIFIAIGIEAFALKR